MKKILLNILIIVIAFSGGIAVAYYTIENKYDDRNELSFRKEIMFTIDALENYQENPNEETLAVTISHIYAARELSQDDMWNALYELWNALLFDDGFVLNYVDNLVLALGEYDANKIENIAKDIRVQGEKDKNERDCLIFSGGVNDWSCKLEFIKNDLEKTSYIFTVIYSGNLEELKKCDVIQISFDGKYKSGITLTGKEILTNEFSLIGSGDYTVNVDDSFEFDVQMDLDGIGFPLISRES